VNELALFAGSGGGLLASQYLLGWRCVCAVEREAYRQANLLARQADGLLLPFPIWSDVRTFDGRPWRGLVDVVTGGFPCQPWSVAGKRQGQADDRNLWPDTKRIIREVGSEFVFLENVPNLLAHRYFGRILADLAALGYRVTWDCIPASAVGANHQRDRLWILAHNANADKFSPDGRGFHPGGVPFEQTPDLQGRALSNADRADDAKNVSRKAGDFTSLTRFVQMFPTPATIDSGSGMINRSPSPGAASRPTLAMMARKDLWPTPIAADGGKHSPAVRHKGGNHTLTSAVLFHTPTAMDATRGDYQYDRGDKTKKRPSLRAQARNFPTPRHRDYKGTAQSHEYKSQEALPNQDRGDGQPIGGKLNPMWVEWLMEWPIGWTSLEVLLPSIVEDWRIKNGCTQKRTDAEGLRGMRDDNDSAPMGERETGQHLFEQEVLQLKVLRSDDGNTESHQRDIPQEGTEGGANEVVRELRGDTQSPETSPRHHETDGGDSALSELPYPSRHATWEMGTWWEQEPDIPRVVSGITERVNRLKAIGDGQVPIVVATAFHVLYHRLVERTP